jgi:hypothetical protein
MQENGETQKFELNIKIIHIGEHEGWSLNKSIN